MNRADHRRNLHLLKKRRPEPPQIEYDEGLVLKAPQHYHVRITTYERLAEDGRTFEWATVQDLVANDVELAASRARALVKRPHSHIQEIRQCADAAHLEGFDAEPS